MKKLTKSVALLLVVALFAVLAACGGSGSTTTAPAVDEPAADTEGTTTVEAPAGTVINPDPTHMRIEMSTAPVGMHPLKTNDSPSTYVNGQCFETLYVRTVDGTAFEPRLAAEMPVFSEDGLSCTIALRQGVTFHDGTPFTSEAVAYMIDCLKNPEYGSQRPSIVESIISYECPDENTIVLNLAYNDGVLVAKLAHTNGAIVNPALDQSKDLMVDASGAGTGPFQFVSAVSGATYELTANENYWNGAPEVKNVTFTVVADEATAVARLQTNEADFAITLLTDSYSAVSAIPGYTTANERASSIYYISCRSNETAKNDLMANSDFRKVILEAVDWDLYCEAMMNGMASRDESIVGSTLVGFTAAMQEAGCGYNPEDAQALVDANGWDGQTVTMLVSTRQWHQTCAAFVQAELAKVGITVEIISEEWATFLDDAKTDDYFDFCILSWSNVTGDGHQMLEPNFSTKNGLRVKYNNAEFDEYVDNAARTTVQEEREHWMLLAVQKIQGDNIVRPIYSQNQIYCFNSTDYSGVVLDKGGQFDLHMVTINK